MHENETACGFHFHMKGFALRLVLKPRHERTRKWPILFVVIAAAVIVFVVIAAAVIVFVARGHCFCCLFYYTHKRLQAIHMRPHESCYIPQDFGAS